MGDFIQGSRYLLSGFKLINQPGVRRFAYIPIFINTLLFAGAIWFGITQFEDWMTQLTPTWLPEWLSNALMWILWPLFAILIVLMVFFTFSILANIVAAPFNGLLAEAVEKRLSNQPPPEQTLLQLIADTPRMIFNELRKLVYLLKWMIPLFILSWIPGINLIAPLLWLFFSSWTLALDYHDYPLGNHLMGFKQQRELLKTKRSLALGFGMTTLGATMIPVVNFLIIPVAVAGATALYVDQLQNKYPLDLHKNASSN
ncbi:MULTISPECIES: sulfate transporter CysZ [unclassified Methylophaga]|uniref:sulfate transporter CysZ n=1 Tax=unclassified Methylophaga TaxID=2629249 RepID=UPI000C90C694|nr:MULTISPECIES: sulfate transporter CysZ [unclassified Methylophaga]MBN45234.1 sulfate transporter CysZ [Methylophaga sp.]|tara:strand:+ start:41290 stop:42060 length:771 start_codon:yes stop_codon:yes gene_type:complete